MARKAQPLKDVPEGEVGQFIEFNLRITPRTKLNKNDVEEMRRRWANYLTVSKEYNMPLGNISAYQALGLSAQQIKSFTGDQYSDNPERGDFLMYVMNMLGSAREIGVMKGYLPPIPTIFAQKNYDGMRDVQEVEVRHEQADIRDIKSIAERYTDVVDVEFEHHKQLEMKKEPEEKP